ncbi:MAG: diguanylate cyclase [Burkholderiales bacterium]
MALPDKRRGLRFARRIYLPRVAGMALAFFAIASVLYENDAHPAAWAGLLAGCFVWPHVAYLLARYSPDPYRFELYNLTADSAIGGVWVALMSFNLLPSVLVVTMLSMDKISLGGGRLLARTATAQVLACGAAVLLFGFDFRPETTMLDVIACLPLLVAYPIAVGMVTHQLSRKVREQNRQLATISRTDGLSTLLNRTAWEELAATEFRRHRRGRHPVSLLMLDIDHFKRINDSFGHPAGDEVIRGIGALLRLSMREFDVAGRYGGEEFGVILPETGAAGAKVIAERVRKAIESAVMVEAEGIRCTVSIGSATAEADVADHGEWIARADRALYRAKQLGRNRTVQYEDLEEEAAAEEPE